MKFDLGQLVVTRGVNEFMSDNGMFTMHVSTSLKRHMSGDWGELCDEDRVSNEAALLDGERLFSVYKKEGLPPIWIITEWDRSVTTVLFPDEY